MATYNAFELPENNLNGIYELCGFTVAGRLLNLRSGIKPLHWRYPTRSPRSRKLHSLLSLLCVAFSAIMDLMTCRHARHGITTVRSALNNWLTHRLKSPRWVRREAGLGEVSWWWVHIVLTTRLMHETPTLSGRGQPVKMSAMCFLQSLTKQIKYLTFEIKRSSLLCSHCGI